MVFPLLSWHDGFQEKFRTIHAGDMYLRIATHLAALGALMAQTAHARDGALASGWLADGWGIVWNMALPPLCMAVVILIWQGYTRIRYGRSADVFQPENRGPLLWALLAFSAGMAGFAYQAQTTDKAVHDDAWNRFQANVDRVEADVLGKFEGLLPPLRGARGALVSSEYLSRSEFRKFMQSRDIDQEFPGVRGLGIIDRIPRAGLNAFVAAQRKDGAPDFTVKTSGTASDLFVIKYVEPVERNRQAVGLDVGAEPVRRAAAERAVRQGKPALTGRITLVQDDQKRAGFLYFLPYYGSVRVPETEAERIRQLRGWTYAPIVLAELMVGTQRSLQGQTEFQLFEGAEVAASKLLFDSTLPLGATEVPDGVDHVRKHMFHTVRPLLIGGQLLTLRASASDDFASTLDIQAPARMALYGSVCSVLAGALVWLLFSARVRVVTTAGRMTAELGRLALVAKGTSNAVVFTDVRGLTVWVNEGFTRITGYTSDEVMGKAPGYLLQNHNTDPAVVRAIGDAVRARKGGRFEILNQHKDGQEYWVSLEIQPVCDARGEVNGFMAIETDITAEKGAKEALVREKERFDRILSGTNVGTWQSNLQTGESQCNARWAGMMGFEPHEVVPNADVFWTQRVHPDDLVRTTNATQRCRQGLADEYSTEVRVKRKDDSWMWILSRAKVMSRTAEGDVEWIGGIHTDISDTKALEIGLRDMESFLHRAGRLAGVGAWEVDLKTGEVKWSEQTCLIHGVEPDFKPTVEEALSFYTEQGRIEMQAAIQRSIDMALGWDVTTQILTAQGQLRWIRVAGEPEFDDSGAVRLVGAFQDVTEQRETQLRIERSEAILRASIDAVSDAYVLYDPQDRLAYCNEKYRELYAASSDLIVPGATFESIIRGGAERGQYVEANGRVDAWVAERMRVHLEGNTNMEQRLDNGRWLRVVERRMPDGHRVGFRVDITELKLANEATQAANATLARTSATLQAVLDSAVEVGIMATDLDKRVTVFNRGAENLTGYAAGDMLGSSGLGRLFERSQMDLVRESLSLQLGRQPNDDEVFLEVAKCADSPEWTLVRKDGTMFTSSMVISSMRDAGGALSGYMAIVYDVTRQKEYEASLRDAMRRAEESSVAKSQFLANMSHEIRTPMNAILGMLQLLHSTRLSPQQLDYADKTEGAARSLLGLLNDILDFSKVEAGKMQLELEPFALSRLLDELSTILSSNLGSKNVDLLFDVDPDIPATLVGDALRIKQVLINLGGNAVKFTEQGHVLIGLRMLARHTDRVRLEISVVDSGIGIAPENQARIFNAFTQAESNTTRRFGGTGLGLVISKRLIRLMGGELELSSALGEGSTFRFALELPVPPDAVAFGERARALSATDVVQTLLVDDNPVALEVNAAAMRSLGWSVVQAASGEQAVSLVTQRQAAQMPAFDAVFVDWHMPGMDGWETLRMIRRVVGSGPGMALVLMSGQSRAALFERTEREQALLNGYMVKPLTADMFRDALAQAYDAPYVESTQTNLGSAGDAVDVTPLKPLGGMRILVVEDNPINQRVASELLRAQGASVTLANNGQEGVDAVLTANPPFDVVLMDLQMPVMDGLTAARTIRSHARWGGLPIIAMTANAMASDREACLEAGMNDHVAKPFDLNDLVKTLVDHTHWTPRGEVPVGTPAEVPPAGGNRNLLGQIWPSGVDVEAALNRMGGNAGLLQRSIAAFLRYAEVLPERVRGWLDSHSLADVRREMHSVKGVAASLGVAEVATLAGVAEKLATDTADASTVGGACDRVFAVLMPMLPILQDISQRLGPVPSQGGLSDSDGGGAMAGPGKARLVASLRELLTALQASDMCAMEMHATLRQTVGDGEAQAMAPLDAAMADLEFEAAAVECEQLISQWS